MAFVRAMAALGRIADRVNSAIYFRAGKSSNLTSIVHIVNECDAALDTAMEVSPPFLHVFDAKMAPDLEPWEEFQRTHVGLAYYHCRILIH
jgi:hypothetical protein